MLCLALSLPLPFPWSAVALILQPLSAQVLEIFQGLGCPDRFQLTYDLLSPSTAPCQALENTPSPPGSGHTSELASVTPLSGACGSPPPEADIQSRAQPLPPPSAEEAVKSSRPPLSPQSKAAPPSLPTAPRIPGPADSCDAFNKFLQGCPTPEGSGLINEKEEGGAEERGGVASLFRQEFSRQLGAAAPDATRSEDDGGGSQGSSDHTAAPGSLGGCRKRNVVPLADLGIARGGGEREGKRGKRVGEDKGGGSAPWETSLDAWRLASGSLPQPDTGGGWQALMISGDSNILCDMLCRPKSQHGEDTEARDLEDFGGNVGGQSLGFSIGIDTLLGVDDAGGDGQEGIAAPGGPSGRPPPLGSSRQGSGESGGGGNAGLSVRPFQELFKAS